MQVGLYRVTAVAAVVSALSILGSYWLTQERKRAHPALTWWAYVGNNFPLLIAFLGMYIFLGEQGQPWGLLGLVAGAAGTIYASYPGPDGNRDGFGLGPGLIALAILLFAVGSLTSGVLPVWVAVLWGGTVLLGIPGMLSETLATVSYVLGGVSFSLGLLAAAYFMVAA